MFPAPGTVGPRLMEAEMCPEHGARIEGLMDAAVVPEAVGGKI